MSISDGRPLVQRWSSRGHGTTAAAGYNTTSGCQEGTTVAAGYGVSLSGGQRVAVG